MGVIKVFSEKYFEVELCNRKGNLMAALVLGLSEPNDTTKIWSGKHYIIHSGDIKNYEMILILLTKVIVVDMRFSQIDLWDFYVKWALPEFCLGLS